MTADLRETVMQARMQPVGNLFGKFPRMVRDLARTCGREVRIEFSGQETGLDKSLLEAIKDPLTHAVRNAVDHGIEPPADRVLAGKPAEGCVRLKAFHQSGSVVIEVSDDGAGIAMERVLTKAVERELVTAGAGCGDDGAGGAAADFSAGVFDGGGGDDGIGPRRWDGCGSRQCGEGWRECRGGVAVGVRGRRCGCGFR